MTEKVIAMRSRDQAIEATAVILRTSCAADGCAHPERTLTSLAETIVETIEDLEAGAGVEDAVLANWDLDDTERDQLFGA